MQILLSLIACVEKGERSKMKWWLLGLIILLLLPFYAFIVSRSIMMGKIDAIKRLKMDLLSKHKSKEEENDKEEK